MVHFLSIVKFCDLVLDIVPGLLVSGACLGCLEPARDPIYFCLLNCRDTRKDGRIFLWDFLGSECTQLLMTRVDYYRLLLMHAGLVSGWAGAMTFFEVGAFDPSDITFNPMWRQGMYVIPFMTHGGAVKGL